LIVCFGWNWARSCATRSGLTSVETLAVAPPGSAKSSDELNHTPVPAAGFWRMDVRQCVRVPPAGAMARRNGVAHRWA
jgi:hypothetical protein